MAAAPARRPTRQVIRAARSRPGLPEPAAGVGQRRGGAAGQVGQAHGPGHAGRRAGRDLAGDQRGGHPGGCGGGEHGAGDLPRARGLVVPALPGDHQPCPGQRPVQAGQPGQLHRPRADLRPPGGGEAIPGAPGRPGPGRPRIPAEAPGQPGQAVLEQGHLGGAGSLLRAEHGGGAGRAEQRGAHVGQAADPAGGGRAQSTQVHRGQAGQGPATGRQGAAGAVEEAGAERGQRARPAVGGRRAAECDHHLPGAGVQRVADDLAEPGRVRAQRVGPGQQGQPAGPGQFHGRDAAGQFQPCAVHRLARRAGDPGGAPAGAAHRGGEHVQGALAAVGQRHADHLVAGPGSVPAAGQRGRRRGRADAALERVGGDHDPHGARAPDPCGGDAQAAGVRRPGVRGTGAAGLTAGRRAPA